ncbi:MAG: IPT/TIG domain-containing protein [Gemmatimonadota bacterium]
MGVTRVMLACGVFVLQACNASDATAPITAGQPGVVNLSLGAATVATTLPTPVRLWVTTPEGRPIEGAQVRWAASQGGSLSAASTATDATGAATVRWTLGSQAGPQTLVANVEGRDPMVFGATALPDRPASIKFDYDEARLRLLGDTIHVAAHALDRFGNQSDIVPALAFENANEIASLEGNVLVARRPGLASVKATADGITARLSVVVDPAAPEVSRVWPDTIVPGGMITIEGANFALLSDAVELTVGGHEAAITRISGTRIEAILPAAGIPCASTAPQTVKVSVASAVVMSTVVLRTATPVVLSRGQSANILDPDATRCTEIVAPAGGTRAKYVFTVINTSLTAAATTGFELHGVGTGALAGRTATAPTATLMSAQSAVSASTPASILAAQALKPALSAALAGDRDHDEHLAAQRAVNRSYGSPAGVWNALRKSSTTSGAIGVAAAQVRASIGDTVIMKALYSSCGRGAEIRARVVYSGSRSVVLEDVAAPRAGQMDAEYQAIGGEFDAVQYPLLQAKIGDPLAMNTAMNGDGRVTMLFTRYVNDSLPGIAGYVTACNFYPKGTFAASNEDEVFYARVASATESPDEWRRSMRSTVIHEAKHLASFAERFVRGSAFEESWLEESTARIAEEMYSRTFANGGHWKGNVGYTAVRCEVLRCDDRPLMMWKHFSVLHQYYRGIDTLTPIGAAANGDFTYYASGWSLVRWAADQYATDEGAWIKALVKGGSLTGLANLASVSGRSPMEMLADWSLANAVDDLPGFTPQRAQLSMPSWNTADVMSGLAAMYPGLFVAAPLKARAMTFGSFKLPVTRLRAFSSSYFSFEGAQAGNQLVELRGEGGTVLPAGSLRVAVVRVE